MINSDCSLVESQFVETQFVESLSGPPVAAQVNVHITSPNSRRKRRGFTLFEVMLAMALTAVVMVLVAGAIDFHLRQLTTRRTRIEETQLARAILSRIADDLRAAIVYRPVDFSSVEALTELGDEAEAAIAEAAGAAPEEDEEETSVADDIANSAAPPSTPGIYGNQYEIQVDVSRIPRYEEYQIVENYGNPMAVGGLSDLKTISYFVLGGAYGATTSSITNVYGTGLGNNSVMEGAPTSGLIRRVVSRATSRWAIENGNYQALDQAAELIAPEIVALQFAYFDGTEWSLEWDSQQRQAIPMAIEIVIGVRPSGQDVRPEDLQLTEDDLYRLVVHLPAGEPSDPDAVATETTESGSSSTDEGDAS